MTHFVEQIITANYSVSYSEDSKIFVEDVTFDKAKWYRRCWYQHGCDSASPSAVKQFCRNLAIFVSSHCAVWWSLNIL